MGRLSQIFKSLILAGAKFFKFKTGRIFSWFKKINQSENETPDVNQQLIMQLNKKSWPTWWQLKHISKILSPTDKIKFFSACLIFIIALVALGWRLYLRNTIEIPTQGGVYTEGLVGTPRFINPTLAATDIDRDLVRLVYSGLVKYDAQGNLVPDLAKAYGIDPDQTTYTFELKDNLRWQDGEPLTAEDIIFTISRVKNPEFASPYRNSFNGVTVRKVNDQTVQFVLEKPFAPFLSILTMGILPEHLWYSIPTFSSNLAELNIKPVGSGPYGFKSLTRDAEGNIKTYALTTNVHYYLDRPFIKELHFKFYADFATAVSALENKNVEGISFLPKEYANELKRSDVTLNKLLVPQYTAIFFNPKNNGLLDDKKFRQALALALDRQRLLEESIGSDGQIVSSPILPGKEGYSDQIQGPIYNPEEAKKILDDLGWTLAEGQTIRQKKSGDDITDLTLRITTVDQSDDVRAINIIKENWEAIGIKTELDIVPKERIKQNIIDPRAYQILLFGQLINTGSGPYPFWHSSQSQAPGLNLSLLADKDIDKYLEESRQAKTSETKVNALVNFQKKLVEKNFAIFLYNPYYIYPTSNRLKGIAAGQFINLPANRFDNVTNWYLKTKRILSK